MQPGTRLLSGPENRCALSIGSEQDDGPLVSQVPESLMKLSGSMFPCGLTPHQSAQGTGPTASSQVVSESSRQFYHLPSNQVISGPHSSGPFSDRLLLRQTTFL